MVDALELFVNAFSRRVNIKWSIRKSEERIDDKLLNMNVEGILSLYKNPGGVTLSRGKMSEFLVHECRLERVISVKHHRFHFIGE